MNHPDPHDDDVTVIAAVSGGKDSTCMSLWLTEQGLEHDRVFSDTGWEHQHTLDYVNDYLPDVIGPITTVRSKKYPGGFPEMVTRRGMFPSRIRRMCTQELKIFPIRDHFLSIDTETINAVGIRAAESKARSQMPEWEWNESFDSWTWRPLIEWSEEQVIEMHKRHNVRPNPLYLMGAGVRRVGCWPCIFSRKEELRQIAEVDPERIVQIRLLEKSVADAAEARYAAKGETFESLGYMRPTMFHDKGRKMTPIPIDDVIDWAKTAHGGKQYLLFDSQDSAAREGCMRWGMCDTEPDPEPKQ